jgi:hypothetical protein
MEDFFTGIYEFILGILQPEWSEVCLTVGIILIVVSLISAAVYYFVLNAFFMHWFKIQKWFLVMLINSLLMTIISYSIAINRLQTPWLDGTVLGFAFINFFYAAVVYFIASCVFFRWSPRARYTPFQFLAKR